MAIKRKVQRHTKQIKANITAWTKEHARLLKKIDDLQVRLDEELMLNGDAVTRAFRRPSAEIMQKEKVNGNISVNDTDIENKKLWEYVHALNSNINALNTNLSIFTWCSKHKRIIFSKEEFTSNELRAAFIDQFGLEAYQKLPDKHIAPTDPRDWR